MTSTLATQRVVQLGALFLIGHGLMGLFKPRWHSLLWYFGPELARAVTEELADYPKAARSVYAAEVAIGIFLASRQPPEV